MTVPMIILAVGSVGAGAFLAIGNRLADWLAPSVGPYERAGTADRRDRRSPASRWLVVAVGVFIAYWLIGRRPVPVTAPSRSARVVALARADVGGNAINETLFARPGIWLTGRLVYADAKGVDGAVNGSGRRRSAACPADGGTGRTASSGPTRCRCSPAPWSSSLMLLVVRFA